MNKKNGLIVDDDGIRRWYVNGQLHRSDGPAVECADGHREWYVNGKRHREDGPAVEHANGIRLWWINGQLHREDGPAIEWADVNYYWYLHDQQLKFAKWIAQLNCSDRERLVFLLKYSHKESVA
jgi:hypothetical protein